MRWLSSTAAGHRRSVSRVGREGDVDVVVVECDVQKGVQARHVEEGVVEMLTRRVRDGASHPHHSRPAQRRSAGPIGRGRRGWFLFSTALRAWLRAATSQPNGGARWAVAGS